MAGPMSRVRATAMPHHLPNFVATPAETRFSRCGTVVRLTDTRVARVVRSMVPADYDLPHDDDIGLAALFCPRCWPPNR